MSTLAFLFNDVFVSLWDSVETIMQSTSTALHQLNYAFIKQRGGNWSEGRKVIWIINFIIWTRIIGILSFYMPSYYKQPLMKLLINHHHDAANDLRTETQMFCFRQACMSIHHLRIIVKFSFSFGKRTLTYKSLAPKAFNLSQA